MDLQKELNEWADWFIPHDSKDFRDALELNSFHQLNIEKLLALNGVSEAYVFRKKDSWKAWFYAKHQAESALLEQFEINNKLVEQIEELKAKAQAVLEIKPSRHVTLTCAQLREAFMFGALDKDDQEQLETEMTIQWSDEGHSGAGYYCYYADYPEEGAIKLGEAQEPAK